MKNTQNKQQEIIQDAFENLILSLPVAQIARLHGCTRQYVSQLCNKHGLKVNRNNGSLNISISTLKKLKVK